MSQALKQICGKCKKMPVYKVCQVILFTYLGTNCVIKRTKYNLSVHYVILAFEWLSFNLVQILA